MTEGIVESSFFKISKYSRPGAKERLPNLQGVNQLNRYEIRKDMRDIERSFLMDDTDSDSSIKSEDILPSTYPVKPRRTQRLTNRNEPKERQLLDVDKDRATIAAADEALNFLRAIKLSKAELYNAEVERERLENMLISYQNAIEKRSKQFAPIKKEQENYIQLLQALYSKYLRQNIAYGRQNIMIYDLIEAIQRRKIATEILDAETKKLKSHIQGKSQKTPAMKYGETAVLKVHLNKANKDITLFKGQWIKTPMGQGQIVCIQPNEHRVTVQLSFGMMYCCLERLVTWGPHDRLDIASDKALCASWNSNKSINIPIEKRIAIRKLIGRVEHESEDFTDQDDDLSDPANGDTSMLNTVSTPTLGEETVSLQTAPNENKAVEGLSELEMDVDPVEKSGLVSTLENMNGSKKIFPLASQLENQVANGRQKLRKALFDDIVHDAVDIRSLAVAFTAPGSISSLIESENDPKKEPHIICCKYALASSDHGKIGASSSLAWNGDIDEMSKILYTTEKGISKLEGELRDQIHKSQSTGSRSLKLMKEISAIRLSMFTKRIRHRNNLGAHVANPLLSQQSITIKDESLVIKRENVSDKASASSGSPSRDLENHPIASKKRGRDQLNPSKSNEKLSTSETDGVDVRIKRPLIKNSSDNQSIDGIIPESYNEEAMEIDDHNSTSLKKKPLNGGASSTNGKRAKK